MAYTEKYQINQTTRGSALYALSKTEVNQFLLLVNDYVNPNTLFTDFSQYILSLRIYPTDFITPTTTRSPWGFGSTGGGGELPQSSVIVGDNVTPIVAYRRIEDGYSLAEFNTPAILITGDNPSWLEWANYDPYTTAQIYIPMDGYHEIDVNAVMNRYVQIRYIIDIATGMATVYVLSFNSSTAQDSDDMRLVTQSSFQFGIDCPFSSDGEGLRLRQNSYTAIKDILIDWPAKSLGGMAGGWMGAVSQGAQASGETLDSIINNPPKLLKGGSYSGNWLKTTEDYTPHILLGYKKPVLQVNTVYKKTNGLVNYNPVSNLTNTHGYTIVSNVHINNSGTMFDTEVEELTQLLTSGVILP